MKTKRSASRQLRLAAASCVLSNYGLSGVSAVLDGRFVQLLVRVPEPRHKSRRGRRGGSSDVEGQSRGSFDFKVSKINRHDLTQISSSMTKRKREAARVRPSDYRKRRACTKSRILVSQADDDAPSTKPRHRHSRNHAVEQRHLPSSASPPNQGPRLPSRLLSC